MSEPTFSQPAPHPRFYADNNVHRLGRGLRTLGYDTKLYGRGSDQLLRQLCHLERRILLSCDSDFAGDQQTLVLETGDWQAQLQMVARTFKLDTNTYRYSLCLNCNTPIHTTDPRQWQNQVPDWVIEQTAPLWRCPKCLRLFWAGSHLDHMNARYDNLFAADAPYMPNWSRSQCSSSASEPNGDSSNTAINLSASGSAFDDSDI